MDIDEDEETTMDEPEVMNKCKFWVFAISIILMIILATFSTIKFVGAIQGPTYEKVPTLSMEIQYRALIDSLDHSQKGISENQAILMK